MSYPIFATYPRLRDLQQGVIARINQEALERIRSTDKDSFDHVRFDGWDLSHISLVLKEVPTTIAISFDLHELDATNIPVFLKCASTLEYMYLEGLRIDEEIIRTILCSCPRLKTLWTMAEGTDRRPFDEVSLNALTAFEFPWISHQIEFLECRIVRVPRPDVVTAAVDNDGHFILPDPPGLAPPTTSEQIQTAQQQSHALQRRIFQQLGQLTHFRVLRLEV
ncbi:hypothetical protein BGX24_008917 [Mortierella sp. AD032]|nr:hypothetical protein BGX24_008917 [Mortierella sp. AD032]